MCSSIRRTLNNRTRKVAQIKFYKAMAVPTLTYGKKFGIYRKKETGSEN
jgi:hypothetical protein